MNNLSFAEVIEKINSHFDALSNEELENNLLEAGSYFYKEYENNSYLTYSLAVQHLPPPSDIAFEEQTSCADSYFPYQIAA